MYLWYLEKIWRKSANPDTKKSVGNEFVSARLGRVGQKCRLLAVGPTCRQHVGDFPSQVGRPKPAIIKASVSVDTMADILGSIDVTRSDGSMPIGKWFVW
jgi:hypothetical protein